MNNIDLTPILQAILGLVAAVITVYLVPWLKSRVDTNKHALVDAAIQSLVYAAEQLYGAGKGGEKLAYVKDQLAKRGIAIDDAAIEAAVYKLLNDIKGPATVVNIQESVEAGEADNPA